MTAYYQDDHVTLYHGDALEITAWLDADVLVTDPPYGIAWSQKKGRYKGKGSQTEIRNAVHGDDSTAARDAVLTKWGGARPALIFGSWRAPRPDDVAHRLIWWKQGQTPGPANAAWMLQDEEIYVLGTGWRKTSPPARTVFATTEQRATEVSRIGHPTPKPLPLMEWLLDRAPAEWVIADPFAGSGSTLVAAKRLGRHAIGVELEERYCEIAARRLSQDVLDLEGLT